MTLKNRITQIKYLAAGKKIFLILFLSIFRNVYSQSIVINEVSQGTSGNQEYVEFLVTGPTLINCNDVPPCIDLRGYIFDDNNGFLNGFPTTGVGIAAGACRFSNDPFWSCIPAGTLIVIYNDADPNGSVPAQDLNMADGNCMINVPVSSALFEKHTTLPSSSNSSYSVAGWTSGGSWTNISMANSTDGFQIYAPTNTTTPVFSIGWGPTNNLGDIYMGSGSAAGDVFYPGDCNYFSQASWITGSAAAAQTPGALNPGQVSCAGLMNANCDPPTVVITPVDETCTGLCDGSATATVTGGMAPYLFSWSPAPGTGQGSANISSLCAGIYTLTLTNDNGNGCVLTETVTISPGPVCCAMTNTESFTDITCAGANDGTITLTQSGGVAPVTFSIDGGTTSQATGNFSNLGPGIYPILIEDGSGCQYISSVTIADGTAPLIPSFTAVPAICSGDPLAALPTTSNNGINGTWSPAINNTATTTYAFTPTAGQCASTTTMTITVNPIITPTFTAVPAICSGDPLAALPTTSNNGINGTWSPAINNTATTTYTFTPTAGQCASTTTMTITVNPTQSNTTNFTICEGSDYTFPDGTTHFSVMVDESYTSTLNTTNGCDSLITTNLTVVSTLTSAENVTICPGDNYIFPDGTIHTNITADETYISSLISVSGCDSLITTTLVVNPTFSIAENTSACENTVFTFPDGSTQLITANTTHTSNLSTIAGCDSIITTNVFMNPVFAIAENVTACENTVYTFPDGSTQTITGSLTYVSNLVTSSGCDSIISTNLTMGPVFSIIENFTICEGSDYTFPDGTTHFSITADETYFSNFTTSSGCDSIISTVLTVHALPNIIAGADQMVCDGSMVTLLATGAIAYSWTGGIVNGVPFIPTQQSQIYTVTGTDIFGCSNSDDVQIDVAPVISPFFNADVTSGCAPLTVTFENLTTGGVNCMWNFGDGTMVAGCGSQTFSYPNSGSYSVTLSITDATGCNYTNTLTNYINVYETPEASFTADQYILDDLNPEVQFTNNSFNATQYLWQFGDGSPTQSGENPDHIFPADGQNSSYTVTLVASNGNSCIDTAQVYITVNDIILFYIPNVFTPDGDNFNENFQPVFTSGFDPFDYHLMIFNRWGELIFESYNAAIGWDGTYSDEGLVLDEVYVWKIEFRESGSDKRHDYYGHVTVLK